MQTGILLISGFFAGATFVRMCMSCVQQDQRGISEDVRNLALFLLVIAILVK